MPFVNRRRDNKKSQASLRDVEKEKKRKIGRQKCLGGQSFPLFIFFWTFERRETDDDREEEDALLSLYFCLKRDRSFQKSTKMSNCCRHILSLSLKSIAAKVERD